LKRPWPWLLRLVEDEPSRLHAGIGLEPEDGDLVIEIEPLTEKFRSFGWWADEAAIRDRFVAVWAGLDDAAWRMPGAAPSDAGGPDWSLLDHVGHVVDWHELATDYIADVLAGGTWPAEGDFGGGDFDVFNETRRARFAALTPAELRERGARAQGRVLAVARRLPAELIRTDAAWGWVHQVLHGHALDHLAVLEPWADALRRRQIENDPFGPDPQPVRAGFAASIARFWADAETILALFDETVAAIADADWDRPTDGDWTIEANVDNIGGWFEIGAALILVPLLYVSVRVVKVPPAELLLLLLISPAFWTIPPPAK